MICEILLSEYFRNTTRSGWPKKNKSIRYDLIYHNWIELSQYLPDITWQSILNKIQVKSDKLIGSVVKSFCNKTFYIIVETFLWECTYTSITTYSIKFVSTLVTHCHAYAMAHSFHQCRKIQLRTRTAKILRDLNSRIS